MEQVHHKLTEYQRLEAEKKANITATTATTAPKLRALQSVNNGSASAQFNHLQQQEQHGINNGINSAGVHHRVHGGAHGGVHPVRTLREQAIAQAKKDGTWLSNPGVVDSSPITKASQ